MPFLIRGIAAVAATAALLIAGGGCGGSDDGSGSKAPTVADDSAITGQVKRYYAALADGDGETACEVLTEQAAKGFEAVLNGPVSSDCKTNIETLARVNVLRGQPRVTRVRRAGAEAAAHVTFERPPLGSDVVLVSEDGVWKLSQIPAILEASP